MKKILFSFISIILSVLLSGCTEEPSDPSDYEKYVIVLRDNLNSDFYFYGKKIDFNYEIPQSEITDFCDFTISNTETPNLIFYDINDLSLENEEYNCMENVVENYKTFIVFFNSSNLGTTIESFDNIEYEYRNIYDTEAVIFCYYYEQHQFSGLSSSRKLSEDELEKQTLYMLVSILEEDYYD